MAQMLGALQCDTVDFMAVCGLGDGLKGALQHTTATGAIVNYDLFWTLTTTIEHKLKLLCIVLV